MYLTGVIKRLENITLEPFHIIFTGTFCLFDWGYYLFERRTIANI